MFWYVRHESPSASQFNFNCYRHWATLLVRDTGDGSGHVFHSKEGGTQEDTLSMIVYVVGVLPLIRGLRGAYPRVKQLWYADNEVAGGKFPHILAHLRYLQARGLPWGYLLEPTKSILVVSPSNVAWAEDFV